MKEIIISVGESEDWLQNKRINLNLQHFDRIDIMKTLNLFMFKLQCLRKMTTVMNSFTKLLKK